MSESDVEAYTPNQLAMAGIKALRRVAVALERHNDILNEALKSQKAIKDGVDRMEVRERSQRISPTPEVLDENPDSETDLGLSEEEKREIEAKEKEDKFWKGEELPKRAMPPVKGKK